MKKIIEIFKNPVFVKLFFANFTSQMGSIIGITAFTFYLLDRFSEQPAYASIAEMMYSLPTLAVFFLVGVLADRMDRQKIAYHCDTISASLSIVLLGAIYIGWMPLIFAILFLRSAVSKFFFPAESGILQGVLSKDDYATSAGLNQMVSSLFMLFGGALGILAYRFTGVYGAIIIDSLSFVVSGLLMRACQIPEEVRLPNGNHKWKDLNIGFVFNDFKVGAGYILKNKLLRSLIVGFFLFGVVNGGFSVMPIFILKYKLAPQSYEEFSVILGVIFGSGVLIGSVISSIIIQKIKFYQAMIIGLLVTGSFVVLSGYASNITIFFVLIFISALTLPLVNIAIGGWMPSIVDKKYMGRVQGWISPLMMLSQTITLGFISASFQKVLSIEALYCIVGGALIIVAIYYMMVLPKLSKHKVEGVNQTSVAH
ncbi:MFS transporter [Heyndrickxia oleronia]|uniref:MFS transporter n=1 Tax=Heyndrickxia oleronia TaxID=38875 RepID=A0A8E2I3X8_9BACI|nr:MFS transporter [Heyndrickxia oleronia]OJH16888.1 MFS transporter [Bacillus obstructivus]MBU5211878.1 MFS transporter [Heyndrickxia oleronia]MEC1372712.1 MFS transporter [Heyndrickxia oleronia]OOP66284.1 MFS transporter [Heyndrickxia oleronia]QQZ03620.1 MFS transporter [Heyndrickxia oleronia]